MRLNRISLIPCLLTAIVYSETLTVPGQYNSIQSAINASNDQDTILVSPGFYQENIDFSGKDIVVTSTYIIEEDSLIIASTIIDGNANAAGEAVVTQGAGVGTLAANVLVCYLVEIEGGNSGLEFCFDALHRIGGDAATGADAVDFDR